MHCGDLATHYSVKLLKLSFLFTAWLFWTFHTKSHNMNQLVILSHSWSQFLPLSCLYGNNTFFIGLCVAFWSIFARKTLPKLPITMTTNEQIWSWPDYCKTNINVSIKLLDLCESLIVYILLSTFKTQDSKLKSIYLTIFYIFSNYI